MMPGETAFQGVQTQPFWVNPLSSPSATSVFLLSLPFLICPFPFLPRSVRQAQLRDLGRAVSFTSVQRFYITFSNHDGLS